MAGLPALALALLGLLALPHSSAFKVVMAPGHSECVSHTIDAEHFQVPGA